MKITLQRITEGPEEMILRFRDYTPEIQQLISIAEGNEVRIHGYKDKELFLVLPKDILYLESVDDKTYMYLKEEVLLFPASLSHFESLHTGSGFFRCSKSMILNLRHVEKLKSLPHNKIDACLENGEHVIITRHYVGEFRELLKGGKL